MAIALVQSANLGRVNTDPVFNVTLPDPPTDGNLLVMVGTVRSGSTSSVLAGWTLAAGAYSVGSSSNGHAVTVRYRLASSGESATIDTPLEANYRDYTVMEFSGVSTFDAVASISAQSGSTLTAGPVTPAASAEILLIAAFGDNAGGAGPWMPVPSGFTEVTDTGVPEGFQPVYETCYRVVSGPSGSYSASATAAFSSDWCAILAVFQASVTTLDPGVYVDWDDDGFTEDDNITSHVARIQVQQGASPEITGGAPVGTATIVLNNPADDRYNPFNTSGPLYGLHRDGRPVWAGIATDGTFSGATPAGLFGGRLQAITPIPAAGGGRALTVELACQDALGWYGRTAARVADGLFRTQANLRTTILDAAGETRTDLAHEIHAVPISGWDGNALQALEELNRANGTRHFVRPASDPVSWYRYVTRNRQWRLDGTIDGSVAADTDHVTSITGWGFTADTVINQQKASVVPVTFTPGNVTVWEAPSLPLIVSSTTPRTIWVEFDDFVTDPVVDKAYSGTAPTVTLEAFGTTAKLTLASSGTTTFSRLSIEGTLLRRGATEAVVIDDAASQAGSRGVRSGSEISGEWVGVLASARGIAEHVVWRYAEPQYRPTLTVVNWFPEMFTLNLLDVIEVTVDQLAMTARRFEIVGRTITVDIAAAAVQSATAVYVLQECRVQSDPGWVTLDSSELDSADILAY